MLLSITCVGLNTRRDATDARLFLAVPIRLPLRPQDRLSTLLSPSWRAMFVRRTLARRPFPFRVGGTPEPLWRAIEVLDAPLSTRVGRVSATRWRRPFTRRDPSGRISIQPARPDEEPRGSDTASSAGRARIQP
eukprot:scaffold598_cov318-Pavlova_lutheri.AAC.35